MNFKKEFATNIKLAGPVMITQLGQVMVNVADNVMVGKMGSGEISEQALSSVSLGFSFFIEFFVIAFGFSFALSPLVAEADAIKNRVNVQLYLRHSFVLNMLISVALIAIAYFISPLMYHLNQPEEIVPDAQKYFMISMLSILPLMIFQTMRQFSEGLSLTVPVTITTIIANVVNIGLNYIFIYGHLGFDAMGVEGAAWGSLIARVLMIVLMIIVLSKWTKARKYLKGLRWEKISLQTIKKITYLGTGSALQMFFEVSAFALAAIIIGTQGKVEMSAHQIAINMASITFMFCVGLSVSSTIRVGNQLGKKNFQYLKEVAYSNIFLVIIIMGFFMILFIVFRNFFPELYVKDSPEAIAVAAYLLIVAAFFQLSDGIQVVTLGCLRGMQDVKIPTWITFIVYYLLTIPLGYYLCIYKDLKALGMWISLGIGLTLSALLLVWRFNYMIKKLIVTS